MRIGLITPGFSADERDWCIPWLLNLARSLAQQHDVRVFSLRYPHRRSSYTVHGAKVYAFGGASAGGLRRLPLLMQVRAAILRQHRQQTFDVFHGLWADEPGFLAVTTAHRLGLPAVVSLLGGELVGFPDLGYGGQLSRANRWLTARALAGANRVTVGSSYLAGLAQPHISRDRLTPWPLGIDTALFQPEGERATLAGEFRLLQVAHLSPIKGQAALLRVIAQLASLIPGLHLHLVGDGPLRLSLTEQARALGLDGRVTFHGEIAHDLLPAFYRSAHLFTLSSRFESQSLAALEAAACGCPIVGTAVGILPDILPPERMAAPDDGAGLAAAILSAAHHPPAPQDLTSFVARQYSLETTVAALLTLYRGL